MIRQKVMLTIMSVCLVNINISAAELLPEESTSSVEISFEEEIEETESDLKLEDCVTTEVVLDQYYEESAVETESYEELVNQEIMDSVPPETESMVNNLKSVEEIIGKTDQIKQISKENEQLMNLQEGELILLSQLSQLVDETTTTLEQYKVAYAINQETGDPLDAMIYRYNGTNHAYILNENAEVTDELKADFKNFIKECYEDGSISAARSESEIVTITAEAFYTDTYIEGAGVEHTGTWGVTTLLEVEPKYTSTGAYDIYTIHAIHRVYPYAWTKYVTTYYSHGINIYYAEDTVTTGTPADEEISLNNNQTYSFAVSIPPSFSYNMTWTGNTGTEMKARRRNHQHDIVFRNNEGVFGTADDGYFQYDSYTNMWGNKKTPFTFLYNEAIGNAICGNGKDFHMYGGEWLIVTPNFNHSPSTDTGFVWEGRDYSCVFNPAYYLNSYQDLRNAFGNDYSAAFQHFINNGMAEGRQAITSFNVYAYMERYDDLRQAFGTDLVKYYLHYIDYGFSEGRLAIPLN